MELDELRQMSPADLRVKEREAREEIFRFRLKLRTNQLESAANYHKTRKELARILTLIAQKEAAVRHDRIKKQVNDAAAG